MSFDRACLGTARVSAVWCALVLAGCAAVDSAPPSTGAPAGAPQAGAPAAPATPQPTTAGAGKAAKPAPSASSVSAAKAGPKAAPPAPAAAAAKAPGATPALAKPPDAAPLDLASLEKRLRETNALGVITKMALKNQVDDLLEQFRAFYQGRQKTTLSALRQPYDRLLMKVLALLQDSDPQLASAISASREAIWGILSDPVKFETRERSRAGGAS